jgi:hypothetical protein
MSALRLHALVILAATAAVPVLEAANQEPAAHCIQRFLAKEEAQPAYRAVRRLEARNGDRQGWLEALTEYSPETGFRYDVTNEGGSGYIRHKVLRAVLDGEREVIAQGEAARAALTPSNYTFDPVGVGEDGLAAVLVSPRRKERVLVTGTMFLRPDAGDLVRLQGRLAKSPSFWVKNVDIVRTYERIRGAVMPVLLESQAELRMLGTATLRMTYTYSDVGGHPVSVAVQAGDE